MKTLVNILFFISFALMPNCNDEESKKNCGCDSELTGIIPESANLIGKISYHIKSDDNDYYSNHYWIVYVEPNCSNCIHSMIVCNEEFLDKEFETLKDGETYFEVSFAGELRNVCNKKFSPAGYTYEHITLTKIEKQ